MATQPHLHVVLDGLPAQTCLGEPTGQWGTDLGGVCDVLDVCSTSKEHGSADYATR